MPHAPCDLRAQTAQIHAQPGPDGAPTLRNAEGAMNRECKTFQTAGFSLFYFSAFSP